MRMIIIGIVLMLANNYALASDAENISACVKKAKEFSGVTLDEFDVSYEGNVLTMSIAKWSNASCEVKLGDVYNLTINGTDIIYRGFAGKESYALNEELERKTGMAINQMNIHIARLKQRKNQISVSLHRPNPDHIWLTRYFNEGLERSFGKQN